MIRALTAAVVVLAFVTITLAIMNLRRDIPTNAPATAPKALSQSATDDNNSKKTDETKPPLTTTVPVHAKAESPAAGPALLTYDQAVGQTPGVPSAPPTGESQAMSQCVLTQGMPVQTRLEFLTRRRTPAGDMQRILTCNVSMEEPAIGRIRFTDIHVEGALISVAVEVGFDATGRLRVDAPVDTDPAVIATMTDAARTVIFMYRSIRPGNYVQRATETMGGEVFLIAHADTGSVTFRAQELPRPNDEAVAALDVGETQTDPRNDLIVHCDSDGVPHYAERLVATPGIGIDGSTATGFVVTRAVLRTGPSLKKGRPDE